MGQGMAFPPPQSALQPAFQSVASQLREGVRSPTILVLTDSTGNYTSPGWPQLVGQALGAKFPNFNVKQKLWNAGNQDYDPATTLQAGPSGDTYIRFTGVRDRFQTQAAIGTITGDLDIRIDCSLDSWSPAASNMLLTMGGFAGNSFFFFVDNAGKLNFKWYESNGTTNHTCITAAALGYAAASRQVLRATLVVATGVATLYSGTDIDAASWTQLATTTAGATSLNMPSGQPYELGGYNAQGAGGGGATNVMTGNVYNAQIRQGIGGPIINAHPVENWMPQLSFAQPPISGSPTLWVINGSHTGATLAYLSDTTRTKMMARPHVDALVLFSCGKNDNGLFGASYLSSWDTYVSQVKAVIGAGSFCFLSQCPDVAISNAIDYEGVMRREREILNYAAQKGYAAIDTYAEFVKTGAVSTYIRADDGIHPTAAGQQLWANPIINAFNL